MTSDNYLFIFITLLCTFTAYQIITSNVTPQERDEMLNDKEMWP